MVRVQLEMNITIVFDDNVLNNRLTPGHGFSCLIKLNQKTILFDTGSDSSILLNNMRHLGEDHKEIDTIVLSHIDYDHVGGLAGILEQNKAVTVYLLRSFPIDFKGKVKSLGATVEEVEEPREVLSGVYTTGELGSDIREQSLIIDTIEGILIITGCAHPGVIKIIRAAKYIIPDKRVYLVMGGFHLLGAPSRKIRSIIDSCLELGVAMVAPCHCSGDETRRMFKKEYGEEYIKSGVGKTITLS